MILVHNRLMKKKHMKTKLKSQNKRERIEKQILLSLIFVFQQYYINMCIK